MKISPNFREVQHSSGIFVPQWEFACNNGDNHVPMENATREKEERKGISERTGG